ncbi:MAG: Zn-ribbon domain-containing OB-fold protein [Candidatus Aminicenantes bacterium]|nr:Zn-ribbon domain-containing OB-fold protein [Candidatus Aminicenantes bacterium]MBL7083268.1 Zn-ribbon domain-containing OB-fold protein [Candidatus Aminicenantes bacterium]
MPTPSRYWREIPQRYRFEANKCKNCGIVFFPPRLICPECKKREFEETKLAEKGKILTYTIIRVPPRQFVDQAPYAVGIVELDDGVKLTAQIVDCDFEDLKIGLKVKLEFRKIFDEGEAGILCYGYKFVPE